MKNLISNFSKTPFLPIFFLAALLMTSCQKERIQEFVPDNQKIQADQPSLENSIQIDVKDVFRRNHQSAAARSATYLILDTIMTVEAQNSNSILFNVGNLPNPTVGKIEVRLIPITANPNLSLYGITSIGVPGWRSIRRSTQPGLTEDILTFRQSDFWSHESDAQVTIWCDDLTDFRLVISGVTVNCEEYEPAEQTITFEYAPVCGCNGQSYDNKSEAFVNGITSWEAGKCANDLFEIIDLTGTWELTDKFDLKEVDLEIHKVIIDDKMTRLRILEPCILVDCDWDWEDLVRNPKTEKYEAIYKLKSETRYFQLELIKEGLLQVELYRDFYEKMKNTTSIYHFKRK